MAGRVLVLDGHPEPGHGHFVHALAAVYGDAARAAGHEVRTIELAALEFPLLRSNEDFVKGRPPAPVAAVQQDIRWASHLVILYPLWLGSMPALVKAFFEQCLRPGFAFDESGGRRLPKALLKGRSARVVVTMGMPSFFYRWFYRAHSLKGFERNVLHFCGIRPARATVVGMVESRTARERALREMRRLGAKAL
jgi:putative NADPH-quinone reductase